MQVTFAFVGLDDFRVKCVIEDGDQLDLEVELVTRAESCPHCTGTELEVHERPRGGGPRPAAGRPQSHTAMAQAALSLQGMPAHPHRDLP